MSASRIENIECLCALGPGESERSAGSRQVYGALSSGQPSAAFLADVVFYPCFIAPDSEAQADTHPVGCGPFKFVRWERNNVTELARFENYFETDAEGNSLPYLERLIGHPKSEDRVRLTALRAGEADLIDNMAYTDAAEFPKKYAGQFQTWDVPILGTSFITLNMDKGPFADKRLRQAAAHAD